MQLDFNMELTRNNFCINVHGCLSSPTTGMYGPSGAGKTTLLYLLAGILKPEKGRIVLNGRKLADTEEGIFIKPEHRRVGMVFQDKLLFPHLSVKQNLGFGIKYNRKRSLPEKRFDIDDVIELLELKKIADSKPNRISGGEQQRTAIGRALLSSPELLLLDEPFNAIDSKLRNNILHYLNCIWVEFGVPMVVISHDLSDLKKLTDAILKIDNGRCTGYMNTKELFEDSDVFPRRRA